MFHETTALVIEAESTLDPPQLLDLIDRFLSDQTSADELIRRNRTWLQD